MTHGTWFLPPDFSFQPDGDLALGTVIAHPSRPTRTLAAISPDTHPEILLPNVRSIVETDHHHARGSSRSLGSDIFFRVPELVSASGSASWARSHVRSLGSVDLEVRTFERGPSADALQKIVALEPVQKHMKQCLFGNRPAYIVSGLRVAIDPFEVVHETSSTVSAAAELAGPTPALPVPLEAGGTGTAGWERSRTDGYKTAPGVVYAFRLHAIRAKRRGDATAELFSHRTAFLTGEGDEDEDEGPQEMECVEVDASVLRDDLELVVDFDEHPVGNGEEACIVFKEEK